MIIYLYHLAFSWQYLTLIIIILKYMIFWKIFYIQWKLELILKINLWNYKINGIIIIG
jgi:hypothetical protein